MAASPEALKQVSESGPDCIPSEIKQSIQNAEDEAPDSKMKNGRDLKDNMHFKKRKEPELVNLDFESNKVFKTFEKNGITVCPLQLSKSKESDSKISANIKVLESSSDDSVQAQSQNNIKRICAKFSKDESVNTRCESVLDFAVLCACGKHSNNLLSECLAALHHLSDSYKYSSLAVCHALLFCSVTRLPLKYDDIKSIEESILKFLNGVLIADWDKSQSIPGNDYEVRLLFKKHHSSAIRLCQELFCDVHFDVNSINISTICCLSFVNLSLSLAKYAHSTSVNYTFKENTLKYILGCTGKSTQEIVSENLDTSQATEFVNLTHFTVQQCLKVIECALTVNTEVHYPFLQHKIFSLPHCLTRLLACCVASLFPQEGVDKLEKTSFAFHRSTLISILKILSVLSFDPNQYDDFTNVKGLMEKIMICGLKAYFELEDDSFDVLILCLELLINLHIKNRKTFVLLCLRKFHISKSETILCVEALIKILLSSLEKIKEIKVLKTKLEKCCEESSSDVDKKLNKEEKNDIQIVLQAADKDMEHSTIASYISVLLVFFANTKQSFLDLVKEKLSSELLEESLAVTRKFLQFVILTGGMPASGILILKHTISKLQKMCSSH